MPIIDKLELALDCKPIRVTEASGKQETRRFYVPPLANAPRSENKKVRFYVLHKMQPGKLMNCHFQIHSPNAGAQQRCEHMGGRKGYCRDGFWVWFGGAPLATIH